MKLNSFLNSLDNKNRVRNFLFQNTRYNPNPTSTSIPFKINPSLLSSTNDAKLNIDYIKQKYGYYNLTSAKSAIDKINQIKLKYIKDYSKNNFKVDSQSITIENKGRNNPLSLMFNNNWDKNLQFEKQDSIFYKTSSPNKLNFDNNKYFDTEKIRHLSNINNEFTNEENKTNESNLFSNKDDNINININKKSNNTNIDFEESWNEQKLNECKNIFPISTRIKMLKQIKKNIDKYTKEDNQSVLKNSSLNSSTNSYTYLDFSKIKPHINKQSIYDEVFTTRENSSYRNNNAITTPSLIKSHSKPKRNFLSYDAFMTN